ncbi:MAG: alpha/beta hydrolase [Clostridia bacterium]|nr:alpha/beta hydrolase [Clostridia bacterium]
MLYFWIAIGLFTILLLTLSISYYCYRRVFRAPKRKNLGEDEFEIPDGEVYLPFKDAMIDWIKKVRAMPHEDLSITSIDGLTLKGKYYECKKGAPIELLFHGYQGNGERDLSGGVERCFSLGRNAIIIDQRACGESEGKVITFGIKEHLDCLKWIDFVIYHFGEKCEIILTGISMGAATVMMTANKNLPTNVKYILADCGYTSPKAIIQKVIKDMKLPPKLIFPFVKIGAKLFGHFNLTETSPIECVQNAKKPIIFIHGENDDFVPCDMSKELFQACSSNKSLVTIPQAGHGLAYPVDKQKYLQALKDFEKVWK